MRASPSFQARLTRGKKPMNDGQQIPQQRASVEGTGISAALRVRGISFLCHILRSHWRVVDEEELSEGLDR